MLNVRFSNKAKSFLRKAEKETEERITSKIEELRIDPFPKGIERVKGQEGKTFRARVGSYRIIYEIHRHKLLVIILDLGHRKDVYR